MLGSRLRVGVVAAAIAGMAPGSSGDWPSARAPERGSCPARAALESLVVIAGAQLDLERAGRESALTAALARLDDGADPLEIAGDFLASNGAVAGTYVRASDGRTWHAAPPSPAEPDSDEAGSTLEALRAGSGLFELAGGDAAWGRLPDGTMYIRIHDAPRRTDAEARDPSASAEAELADGDRPCDAIADLLAGLSLREPVIIDLRGTTRGCPCLPGLASWFATEPTVACHTAALPAGGLPEVEAVEVCPHGAGGVSGPVVLLTDAQTAGSAEALTLSTMPLARVTRVGARTSGTCRPIIEHPLGGGWVLGLPSGRFLSWDRVELDGVGIAPHISAAGTAGSDAKDAAVEAALAYIQRLRTAGLVR